MKRKYIFYIFLFTGLFGSIDLAEAQTVYGFRIGATLGTLSGSFGAEPSSSVGLVAGSFAHYALRNDFGAQVEVLYSQKGAQFEATTIEGEPFERTLQATYLEIPVLLTYSPRLSTSIGPVLYAGAAVGFEISEQIHERLGDFEQTQGSDDLTSPDLGVVVGLDVQLPVGSLDALLGARYTSGLRDLASPEAAVGAEVFTRTFALTVGFLF